jgi:predicted ATPase/DNA-binding SARP family transcriptional activator
MSARGEVAGAAQAALTLRLLGGFDVSVAERRVAEQAWRLRRAKTLLKLLALAPEHRIHRDQVTEALWPEEQPAASALHQVLYTARRALQSTGDERAAACLTLHDDVITLACEELWIDVVEFERAAAQARAERTLDGLSSALELYTGELLPEDLYEEWTAARREALRETHLSLLVELAELLAEQGDDAGAVAALQRAVVAEPLHERAHRALMRRFAADGRRQQALAQYEQLRAALRQRLEADPDPETRQLYREILASQHAPAEPVPDASVTGGPAQAASTAAGQGAAGSRSGPGDGAGTGLPHQLTSFIGREGELGELESALERTRLLTLTGPGGAGKTRLALELAARRESAFAGGVHLVELAAVGEGALVAEETAASLGMRLRSERDPVALLAEQIGERHLMLVLDNCEHLIETCATLADRLLRACPNLHVLATSRERLRIDGEIAWRVPPLSLPERRPGATAAPLQRFEAVRLFCERAAEAAQGFELTDANAASVAAICRGLDGMPLAIELAAARTAMLTPEQIAERLGDALALLRGGSRAGLTRQQTLRATLEWSHDLLSEPERLLYRRLGVFAGSFGLDAVEGICAEGDTDDVLGVLARLVDKSLVQVEIATGANRYRLLETVRQFALELLAAAGEGQRIEAAHRGFYCALARAADRDLDPDAAGRWSAERLECDHDNLRVALVSALRHDPPGALRLACSLWWFWMTRGYFAEGRRWLTDTLAACPEPTPERARALFALGAICVRTQGFLGRTVVLGREALAVVRSSDDRRAEARAFERLAVMGLGGFDWDAADDALSEGHAIAREAGDHGVEVAIRQAQGVIAGCRGQIALARELLGESRELLGAMSHLAGPLFWAVRISPVVLPAGAAGAPRMFFEDTFCLFRAAGARAGAAYVLCNIAETWRAEGEHETARRCLLEASEVFAEVGDEQGRGGALNALGNLARVSGDFQESRESFAQALAIRREAEDSREIATTLTGLGLLDLYEGETERGRRTIEEVVEIYERTEDAPGLEGVPLNLGAFELDHGDRGRACELLARSAEIALQRGGLHRTGSWALAELAEGAIGLGDGPRAREALDGAMSEFRRYQDERGLRYVELLASRLPGEEV